MTAFIIPEHMAKKVVKFTGTIKLILELSLVFGTNLNRKKKCTSKRERTPYWGTVKYTVNSGETAFTGVWGYCAGSPTHKWSGTLK